MTDFNLPELGENIKAGDVLRVLVKPGDTIAKDQAVLELETDKATIEVPSSVAGEVKDIKVKAGDKVKVGQTILTVDDGGKPAAEKPADKPAADKPVEEKPAPATSTEAAQAKAGGEGGKAEQTVAADKPAAPSKVVDISRGARGPAEPESSAGSELPPAPAAPSVRRTARELGVDINEVAGTGDGGRISVEDVKSHVKRLVNASGGAGRGAVALPDFTRWGAVERQPMRAVRRKTAEHLSAAWATIPHVTQCDLADVTALEESRKKYAKPVEAAGGNLTVTAIAVKIVASALKVFPQFNASIDIEAGEIVTKQYVNIGVAVDTDRGLLVPVIRDADRKNITQISVEIAQLSEKARSRKIAVEEMQGGCFSISNLGGIGGTYFTPIVNAPEVAILGISRGSIQPKWIGDVERGPASGAFVPRMMLPLSLSYDHRAIDGADAIRFLRWIVSAFEEPFVIALNG